jgi:hypothetical protein
MEHNLLYTQFLALLLVVSTVWTFEEPNFTKPMLLNQFKNEHYFSVLLTVQSYRLARSAIQVLLFS